MWLDYSGYDFLLKPNGVIYICGKIWGKLETKMESVIFVARYGEN